MKKITILGSTGSIGTQTLAVVRERKAFSVECLTCGSNIQLLEEQIREFSPKVVAVKDEAAARELKQNIRDLSGIRVLYGIEGLTEAAAGGDAEMVVTAVVGMVGVRPTIEAVKAGKDIALANKETLVTAGHLIMPLARENDVEILPVDSEHSAIFQCLQGNDGNQIARIWLTASGGPFRGWSPEALSDVTVEDALQHPNWSMGAKITIDSATMVNKGLEVMEATHLFRVTPEQVSVLIQPKSVIHSMVEFQDGAVMAQLGTPDMRLPIQYAMMYPARAPLSGDRLDFYSLRELTFEEPDNTVLLGLPLAYEALSRGGNVPTIYNAANEMANRLFRERRIGFLSIYEIIQAAMEGVGYRNDPSLADILQTEKETYELIEQRIDQWELL